MTPRLMDCSIHTKQDSKGAGGVIWSICLLQDCPARAAEEKPLKTFRKCSVTKSSLFLSELAPREYSSAYPKFLAACTKMNLCEGRRLPHFHCSSSPSTSGAQLVLPPTTQETEWNPSCDPRARGKDQVRCADEMTNTKRHRDVTVMGELLRNAQ